MRNDDRLNNLSVSDLHKLLMSIAAIANNTKLSEEASEWAIGLHHIVQDAFYAATAKTSEESLMKLITLGDVDIGNGSIFGHGALVEAMQFLNRAA